MTSPESALWAVIAQRPGELILIDFQDGSRREQDYIPVDRPARFERVLPYLAERDARVGLVPRIGRHLDGVGDSQVLWVRGETGDSWGRLRDFRPFPTLVFRDGRSCRYTAVWWLERPLPRDADPSRDWLTRANRRLAKALGGRMLASDPEWLMPYRLAVLVSADPSRRYSARRVVGRLREWPVQPRRPVGQNPRLQTTFT